MCIKINKILRKQLWLSQINCSEVCGDPITDRLICLILSSLFPHLLTEPVVKVLLNTEWKFTSQIAIKLKNQLSWVIKLFVLHASWIQQRKLSFKTFFFLISKNWNLRDHCKSLFKDKQQLHKVMCLPQIHRLLVAKPGLNLKGLVSLCVRFYFTTLPLFHRQLTDWFLSSAIGG